MSTKLRGRDWKSFLQEETKIREIGKLLESGYAEFEDFQDAELVEDCLNRGFIG